MPKKKKCKKLFKVNNGEDRISKLPDELIGNILSRLITRDAVATSVLSKDWKYKWHGVNKIDINLHEHNIREEMLLSFHGCLESFFQRGVYVTEIYFLSWYSHDFFYGSSIWIMTSLISAIVKCKAEILHIDGEEREVVLHGSLISRDTLRELVLEYLFFKVPAENCFSLLKTLRLHCLEISNETDNTTTLKFTFPVLETLQIYHCAWPHVKSVEIYVPSLRRLQSFTDIEFLDDVIAYEIKIFGAAGLVSFQSCGDYIDNILFVGSNSISARIQTKPVGNRYVRTLNSKVVRNLPREFLSNLENLELSFYVAQILAKALVESNHGFTPPIFNKLKRLFLSHCGEFIVRFSSAALFLLLHAAPYLKSLVIRAEDGDWDDYDYDAAESLPSCLFSTLEEIELSISIEGDDWSGHHVRLAKFLMQMGEKAELKVFECEILVEGSEYSNSDKLMQGISSFPRAPPHFTLCATEYSSGRIIKTFCYRESSGWVEDV